MSVSPSYRQYVVDCMERVVPGLRATSMFGGVGLYAGELFFALIARDTVYFKVDDSNRPDFVTREMGPFLPFGDEREVMQYYELPAELLDEPEELRTWVEKAVAVARRAKQKKTRRKP